MRIAARRAFPGITRGERRSTRKGSSVEFADFRKYEIGDDFRHVDWNIYARLERLILKQFVEDEDVRIDILIDQSQSMRFGDPINKLVCACRTAAALAFLGVASLDRVSVSTFDSALRSRMRALRGRGHLLSLLSFLAEVSGLKPEPSGISSSALTDKEFVDSRGDREVGITQPPPSAPTDLKAVLRAYQKYRTRAGVVFVISDFMDPGEFTTEMKLLVRRGFDLNLVQVLTPEELNPQVGGDLLVVDSETGQAREVTVNERVLTAYRVTLEGFTSSLETLCRANGLGYMLLTAQSAFEELLFKNLIETRMAE